MPLVFKSHSVIWQLVTLFLGVRGSTAFSTSWTNALLAKSSRAFVPRSQAFTSPSTRLTAAAASSNSFEYALLFDCDGVILETEELHRLAYNQAFQEFNLTVQGQPVVWEVAYYDILQNTVGGGIPKMFWHFRNTAKEFPNHGPHPQSPAPETIEEQQTLIAAIQDCKTQYYKKLLASPSLQARPGVLELMDAAFQDPTIAVGVCSAATKAAAVQTLDMTLGPQRVQQLDVCILGDDVTEKKPHPMIYDTARQRLGSIASERCIVVEDSLVGLRAAKGANMKCIITYTSSTAGEDFYKEGADAKVPNLGEVTLESIFAPLREKGDTADLLAGIKDPAQTSAQS